MENKCFVKIEFDECNDKPLKVRFTLLSLLLKSPTKYEQIDGWIKSICKDDNTSVVRIDIKIHDKFRSEVPQTSWMHYGPIGVDYAIYKGLQAVGTGKNEIVYSDVEMHATVKIIDEVTTEPKVKKEPEPIIVESTSDSSKKRKLNHNE